MMRLSSDDIGLWRRAMRDVIPLRGREFTRDRVHPARSEADAGEAQAAPANGTVKTDRPRPPPVRPAPLPPLAPVGGQFAGLDRASAKRPKRGRYPVEARLDLHGMTQAEAHRALNGFVAGSRAIGRRVVLVITGHGRMSGGILKSAVPRWLNEPDLRRHLLALTPAQPRDGGTAALYLLLRKAS